MITEGKDVLDSVIAGVNIVELDPLDDSVGYGVCQMLTASCNSIPAACMVRKNAPEVLPRWKESEHRHALQEWFWSLHPKDAGMEALKRIQANTVEKRLRRSDGNPNFNVNFYILNAKGEFAGVTMYEGPSFAICNENGPQTLKSEGLLQGKASD